MEILIGEGAESKLFGIGDEGQTIEAILSDLDVCAGIKYIAAAYENSVLGLVRKMGSINACGVVPCIAFADDCDFEFIAVVEVDLDGEGVECICGLGEEKVILRPDPAPGVLGIAAQRACEHPGTFINLVGLPCYEYGSILGDGLSEIKGNEESRGCIEALYVIAFLCQLGLLNGLAALDFDLLNSGNSVALIEGNGYLGRT